MENKTSLELGLSICFK